MRLPRTGRSGRGRSAGVAEHHSSTALSRARVLMVASLVALVSVFTFAPVAVGASTTSDQIAQTRARIDATAQQWFASRADAAKLDSQIAELERKVADARAQADRTAVIARDRALAIYKGSGTDLGPVLSTGDALDSVRRAELLDRANAQSQHAIDDFETASQDLAAQRDSLQQRRAQQAAVVQQLTNQQAALEQQLSGLQTQAQREAAAAAKLAQARAKAAASRAAARSSASPAAPAKSKSAPSKAAPVVVPAPPPPSSGMNPHHDDPFLVCTRARESGGNYGVVSASGLYYGAYQFAPTTWDVTASRAGRIDLIGVPPNQASAWDQDEMAWTLYQWQGKGPWGGRC
jgi:peptidoglycan hydrolase CwlO-like protein